MAVLIAADLKKDMAGDPLWKGLSFKLERRDRMTLSGRNGAGKTTLLRILAGQSSPDGGDLALEKGARVVLHDQRPPRERGISLRDYVVAGRQDLVDLEARLRDYEQRMADGDMDVFDAYSRAQAELETKGGYRWRDEAADVIRGLGFTEDDLDRQLETFSGGQLTRASLARALSAKPDLLLLDEPTNHLDLESLEWLEKTLVSLESAIVLVAHDRWFLEAVGTSVLEIEAGRAKFFPGTWHQWRREQAAREMALGKSIAKQEAQIAKMEDFVRRFSAKATKAKQAQSRVKALEKIDKIERDPTDNRSMGFQFKKPERAGRIIFELEHGRVEVGEGVELRATGNERDSDGRAIQPGEVVESASASTADDPGRPHKLLLDDAELWLERGEHVALVGPNGVGKTTLIETLAGRRPLQGGRISTGHNVQIAYLSQHGEELEHGGARTVLESCIKRTGLKPNEARSLLGKFLFSGQDAEKEIAGLSGGERKRLGLAILVASGANVLVLDEPTNHLDIESREALEDALQDYPGSMILVSHDRALLEAIGTRCVAVEDRKLHSYLGGWQEYVDRRTEKLELERASRDGRGPAAAPAATAGGGSSNGNGAKAASNGGGRSSGGAKKTASNSAGPAAGSNGGAKAPTLSKNKRREIEKAETKIEQAEEALAALEVELAGTEAWATPEATERSTKRHEEAREKVASLYARLEQLTA